MHHKTGDFSPNHFIENQGLLSQKWVISLTRMHTSGTKKV